MSRKSPTRVRKRSILPPSLCVVVLIGLLGLVPWPVFAQYGSAFIREPDSEPSADTEHPLRPSANTVRSGGESMAAPVPSDETAPLSSLQDDAGEMPASLTGESLVEEEAEGGKGVDRVVPVLAAGVQDEGEDVTEASGRHDGEEGRPGHAPLAKEEEAFVETPAGWLFLEAGEGDAAPEAVVHGNAQATDEDTWAKGPEAEPDAGDGEVGAYPALESPPAILAEETYPPTRSKRETPTEERPNEEGVHRCDPGGPLGIRAFCYEDPGQLLASPWLQIRHAAAEENPERLQPAMNQLYEAKLDAGFPNAPAFATLLIREAYRFLSKREFDAARLFGETACDLSPDFYPSFDFMARLARQDARLGMRNFVYWKWVSWKKRAGHFVWQYRSLGKLYLVLVVAFYLFFLFWGLYLALRYGRILSHAIRERMRSGVQGFFQLMGLLILGLLAMLLLPGFFWIAVLSGTVFGRYAKRWEKAVFLFLLGLWACSPWIVAQGARFLSPLPEAVTVLNACTQDAWSPAFAQKLDDVLARDPQSPALLQAKALVRKRQGNVQEAGGILEKAVERHPDNGALWNNLGNVLAIQGNLRKAREAYRTALEKDSGLASAHYNLSQLLRRDFDFMEGGREFEKARRIDAARVDSFAYIHTQNANRFFMDEELPVTASWAHLMRKDPETAAMADRIWVLAGTGVPLEWSPWFFIPLAVVSLIVMRRRNGFEPFACSTCGIVICARCQPGTRVSGICIPCYQSLYHKDRIVRERRNSQIRTMVVHHTRRSRNLLALNLLFPGLGLSLHKERVWGILLLFGFLSFVLIAFCWNRILPSPWPVWETGHGHVAVAMGVALMAVYLGIQIHFLRKIKPGR